MRAAATLEDFKKLGCAGPGIVGVDVCYPSTTGVEAIELLVEPRIVATFLDHDHDNRNTKTSGLSRMPYNDKKMKPKRVGRLFVAAAVIASRHTTIKNTAQMGSMSMSSIRNTGRNMPQEELLATLKRCQG